jgi:Flp pilus assembly protein TadD
MVRPTDTIDDSVYVYQGAFAIPDAAALARAQQSSTALRQKQPGAALALAREAVAIAPGNLFAQMSLGDAEAETGDRQAAQAAWQTAIQIAKQLEPDAQPSYIPDLQAKINRLTH